ncbi:hypothetical protein HLV38_02200 [Berryella wangjianweii]|uniref:Nitrogenase/oxidoreductase component 1 domain-containing protein n=1 Tax=Berryella wangjianweii TaxID=2734634 RepID=A0A6M8J881_9ACTN|nr:nitrogenase component 1 [Berryella wangjianweii]QKF07072.1 hypothetical protein HLV38_02200 [Berryella wangjianweii]
MPKRHRDRLRVPESHTVYVCPMGCGRRHALRLIKNGMYDDCSFCFISNADVASGNYEQQLPEIIANLVDRLSEKPRVVTLAFNCIDDFLGTDAQALMETLRGKNPDIRFSVTHINPVAENTAKKALGMQSGVYDLLEASTRQDCGITLVGRFNSLPSTSEFCEALRSWGVSDIRSVCECKTYAQYEDLAASSLLLGFNWTGKHQCVVLEKRLLRPVALWETSYDPGFISANYDGLYEAWRESLPSPERNGLPVVDIWEPSGRLAQERERAVASLEAARQAVGKRPIVIDSLATFAPYATAQTLADAGFKVAATLVLHGKDKQERQRQRLARTHPEISQITSAVESCDYSWDKLVNAIAIGSDAASNMPQASCVDMFHDEGFFGFDGVTRFARLLAEAASACPGDSVRC